MSVKRDPIDMLYSDVRPGTRVVLTHALPRDVGREAIVLERLSNPDAADFRWNGLVRYALRFTTPKVHDLAPIGNITHDCCRWEFKKVARTRRRAS